MTTRANHLEVLALALVAALMLAACMLALVGTVKPAGATFPGPNGKIAYTVRVGDLNSGIYTINPGGGGKTKVTVGDTPSYSPDGKKIAYTGYEGNDPEVSTDTEIYTINVGGGGKTQVTNNNTYDSEPSYSPDGKKIAYTGYEGNDPEVSTDTEIYTINAGGGAAFNVTNNDTSDSNPDYSPNGEKIAYTGTVGQDTDIYTINAGGGAAFNVTNNDTGGVDPSWGGVDPSYSPDGKRIAYIIFDEPDTEIYTINVGGGGEFRVTNNTKDEEDPSYSPDGKKIAYTGYKGLGSDNVADFDHEIYTINVGGGGKSQVTNNTNSFAHSPSWGRRP